MTKYNEKSKVYSIQYAKDKIKRIPLNVPIDEYQAFKTACVLRGEKVNTVLREYMKLYASGKDKAGSN